MADTEAVQAESGVDTRPKSSGGKTRLLSLEDLDRRTASYRKTAEFIDRVEADLGGADRLSTAETDHPACCAHRCHARGPRDALAQRRTDRSGLVRHTVQFRETFVRGGWVLTPQRDVTPPDPLQYAERRRRNEHHPGARRPEGVWSVLPWATWVAWRVFLAVLFGLPLTSEQLALYTKHTGRTVAPTSPLHEAWFVYRTSWQANPSSSRVIAIFLAASRTGGRSSARARSAPS